MNTVLSQYYQLTLSIKFHIYQPQSHGNIKL
jgi:hypothetical protein